MVTKEEHKESLYEAASTSFNKELWEIRLYAAALSQAKEWGNKKTQEDIDYRKKHRLNH